jgi:hypothetical protein
VELLTRDNGSFRVKKTATLSGPLLPNDDPVHQHLGQRAPIKNSKVLPRSGVRAPGRKLRVRALLMREGVH